MISMTSWKNRLRRMLFLYELESLVGQTQKVAELCANSATGNVPPTNIDLIFAKEPRSLRGQRPGPLRKSPN